MVRKAKQKKREEVHVDLFFSLSLTAECKVGNYLREKEYLVDVLSKSLSIQESKRIFFCNYETLKVPYRQEMFTTQLSWIISSTTNTVSNCGRHCLIFEPCQAIIPGYKDSWARK